MATDHGGPANRAQAVAFAAAIGGLAGVALRGHRGARAAAVGALAHVGVLTRPDRRRRGLGAAVAAAVVRDALAAGLVAQWRARTELTASRRLAGSLGFVELGQQVSYELAGRPPDRR